MHKSSCLCGPFAVIIHHVSNITTLKREWQPKKQSPQAKPAGRFRRFAAAKSAGQGVFPAHMSRQKHLLEKSLCYHRLF